MEVLCDQPAADLSLESELDRLVESYAGIAPDDAVDSGRESSGPDEAVFDHPQADRASSPGTSNASDDDVSDLPGSRRTSGTENGISDPFTPTKHRSAFRTPSSVREMQLDTTPPHLMSSSQYHKYRLGTASRNSTPKSIRSWHSGPRSARSSPTKSQKKEFPLVLLHVSLLPVTCPYSPELMEAMMPPHVIENWKLLGEKVPSTVIDRGILIPHPREDYDVLEERLLETLELKAPRILKCGHFHLTEQEQADIEESEDEYDNDGGYEPCKDCGRRIRDGQFGSGSGDRRWSIKVYASNGLMKAGAWGAAWREMERVDVEILPWIEDDLRRQMDLRQEEELRLQVTERTVHESPRTMDEARRREIYGETIHQYVEQLPIETKSRHNTLSHHGEVPLSALLFNYIQDLLQDQRNVAIGILSLCVLYLAFRMPPTAQPIAAPSAPSQLTASMATVTTATQVSSASTFYDQDDAKTVIETATVASIRVEIPVDVPLANEAVVPPMIEEVQEMPTIKEIAATPTLKEVAVTPTVKEVAVTPIVKEVAVTPTVKDIAQTTGIKPAQSDIDLHTECPVIIDSSKALVWLEPASFDAD